MIKIPLHHIKKWLKNELKNSYFCYSLSILVSLAILLRNILSNKFRLKTGDFDFKHQHSETVVSFQHFSLSPMLQVLDKCPLFQKS